MLTPLVNSLICFSVYLMKASELQCPTSMIVYTSSFARYMSMARLARGEWIPTSSCVSLRARSPMQVTAALISLIISKAVILEALFVSW